MGILPHVPFSGGHKARPYGTCGNAAWDQRISPELPGGHKARPYRRGLRARTHRSPLSGAGRARGNHRAHEVLFHPKGGRGEKRKEKGKKKESSHSRGINHTSRSPCHPGGWCDLLGFGCPLGCFERVDLHLLRGHRRFHVSREIAMTRFPLDAGIGIAGAKTPRRDLDDPLASFALFHHLMASAPVVPTARFGHEGAVRTRLHRLTNHGDHLRFRLVMFPENRRHSTHENFTVKRHSQEFFETEKLFRKTEKSG